MMARESKLWLGGTLLAVLIFNYAIFAFPLYQKSNSIKEKYKSILIKQVKSGEMMKSTEDEYMLELFRREKSAIDGKLGLLNCLAASFAIIIASWTAFSWLIHKKKSK